MQLKSTNGIHWQKWGWGIAILLLLSVASWLIISKNKTRVALPPVPVVSEAEFTTLTGVEVTLIAITGGGGFVDFRVRVLDVAKATAFFADPSHAPYLVVEESGVQLPPPADAAFDVALEERGYYTLYANAGNAVKQGALVSVWVGDVRLEAIPAQ